MSGRRRAFPPLGLYAITSDHHADVHNLVRQVEHAITGGARVIQYRGKLADRRTRRHEAIALRSMCASLDIPFIVNDDIDLAQSIDADGVHVGKDDGDFRTLRDRLGREMIIGVSCYASVRRALAAQASGATYVALGRFFPSASKPLASPCPMAVLLDAGAVLNIPIVAIGGITPDNGGRLVEAGADLLAVIGGVFAQGDVEAAARSYQKIFNLYGEPTHP